jgi:hypothetical protein
MDYVDHRTFIKKNWDKDRQSHRERIDVIVTSPSNRIDNKLSPLHHKAPCWKKPKSIIKNPQYLTQAHLKSLDKIKKRSVSKDLVDRIESINGYSTLSKKFRTSSSLKKSKNPRDDLRLTQVKSNLSIHTWQKDFKRAMSYKKRISKPHVEQKHKKRQSQKKRPLIEVQFLSLN